MQLVINRRSITRAVFYAGAMAAFIWWLQTPPPKARQLLPLLKALNGYMATNGIYPTSCVSFAAFSQLTQHFSVYTGERDTNGVTWDPQDVSGHDFTVLVDRDGYEVFLPVGRMKMITFSGFPVWRYSSADHQWQKGRIHWSIVPIGYEGSYWSKD